jgi:hypothetical protein
MSGMNARQGRAKGGEAVQPYRAVASAPREHIRPQPFSQQDINSQTSMDALSDTPGCVTRAQLADKLREVSTIALRGIENAQVLLVPSRSIPTNMLRETRVCLAVVRLRAVLKRLLAQLKSIVNLLPRWPLSFNTLCRLFR